jgi:hypothetical protein
VRVFPPRPGVAGQCGIKLSKNGRSQRPPGRTHAHRSDLLLTVRPRTYAWELTVEGVIKPLRIIMNSLQSPRDDETGSVESVQVTRVLSELVAASRNLRFGGRPSSAVRVSQRRHMNCYRHSSTDFQTRRETFKVYFCAEGGRHFGCLCPLGLVPVSPHHQLMGLFPSVPQMSGAPGYRGIYR